MTNNVDIINAAVALIVKAAILASRLGSQKKLEATFQNGY